MVVTLLWWEGTVTSNDQDNKNMKTILSEERGEDRNKLWVAETM